MVSEDLERLIMASKLSCTDTLPRIWAIEVLATSKQFNMSELIDLVRKTPELSDDIGKNARELISLRILETLSVQRNRNNHDDDSAVCQKIEFDPSNSCEDVLRHIFQELSPSNLKLGASGTLKWDVESFITQKRDCLPKFALQKLKDAIVEGSHSIFASLKERSGVVARRTQCDDNIPTHGVNPNRPAQSFEERSKDTQVVLLNQKSSLGTTKNGVDELQEKLADRNSLPFKRNRTDITGGNLETETHEDQVLQGDCYDPYAESAKKFKQDIHVTELAAVEKSITAARDGLLANSSERIVEHIDREGCNLENEAGIGGMEVGHAGSHDAGGKYASKKSKQDVNITEHATVVKSITSAREPLANSSERIVEHMDREGCNSEKEATIGVMDIEHTGSPHAGGNQCAALKMLARCSDVVDAGDWNRQKQTTIDDNIEVNMPGEMQGQSNCVDKANGHMEGFEERASNGRSLGVNEKHDNAKQAINSFHHSLQENTPTGPQVNDDIVHNQVLQTASDSDEYHDERNDIASKKNAFLSSQCTYSEDSFATQPNLCMKCDSGGQLLICSSNTCPLMVHESCLGSAAKFDGDGKFYCPFCAYSRAISEYLEVKKKASMARKNLATFIGLKVGHQSKLSMRSHRSKQNQVRGVDGLCENNEASIDGNHLNEVDHTHWKPNVKDNQQAEPSMSCAGDGLPRGEKVAALAQGELKTLEKENLEGEGREQQCPSPIRPGEQQTEVQALHKSDGDISSHKQADIVNRNERQTVTRGRKKVTHQQESSLPSEPPSQTSCEGREQECQSPIRPGEQQIEVQALHKSDGDISSHKQADIVKRNERLTVTRGRKKVTHPQESPLPSESSSQTSCGSSEEEDEKSSASKYSMRSRRLERQYMCPAIPHLRRKRHPWTKVEEEKLKEGVQRFSSAHDLSIPWKTILEFGGDVFQKGRTTVDLKDKWRNICKGGAKSK